MPSVKKPKPQPKSKGEPLVTNVIPDDEDTLTTPELATENVEKAKENKTPISTAKLDAVMELVSGKFNLLGEGFRLNSVDDKGTTYKVGLANRNFKITIQIDDLSVFNIEDVMEDEA